MTDEEERNGLDIPCPWCGKWHLSSLCESAKKREWNKEHPAREGVYHGEEMPR